MKKLLLLTTLAISTTCIPNECYAAASASAKKSEVFYSGFSKISPRDHLGGNWGSLDRSTQDLVIAAGEVINGMIYMGIEADAPATLVIGVPKSEPLLSIDTAYIKSRLAEVYPVYMKTLTSLKDGSANGSEESKSDGLSTEELMKAIIAHKSLTAGPTRDDE